jgi:hypothetical protein
MRIKRCLTRYVARELFKNCWKRCEDLKSLERLRSAALLAASVIVRTDLRATSGALQRVRQWRPSQLAKRRTTSGFWRRQLAKGYPTLGCAW